MLRVAWEARNEAASNVGSLRVSVHSAVSGRLLALAVDHRGVGRDTAYVYEDPRAFYLVIESANLDWSVEVAEGIPATRGAVNSSTRPWGVSPRRLPDRPAGPQQ